MAERILLQVRLCLIGPSWMAPYICSKTFPRCLKLFSCCLANSQPEILRDLIVAFSCLPTHHRLAGVGSAAQWEGPQPFGCHGLLLVVFKALLYSSKLCLLSRAIKSPEMLQTCSVLHGRGIVRPKCYKCCPQS